MSLSPRWRRRPEGSNWGDFGPDDQLGRINLLTPRKVLEGIAEVREGRVFCLSLPLNFPGGTVLTAHRHPPVLRPTLRDGMVNINRRVGGAAGNPTDVVCDDAVILHTQYSTQWDGLVHNGQMFDADGDGVPEPVYYNGFRAGEHVIGPADASGAGATGLVPAVNTTAITALGIENMAAAGVQGRGVMIDLHAHVGRTHALIGYDELMRIMDADGVTVEPGDMVCLHTGFAEMLLEMDGTPDQRVHHSCAALNGRDTKLLQWITDSQLAVLVADNAAVERLPSLPAVGVGPGSPIHEHCLFKLGVHLGELWHLTPLAQWLRAAGRHRFLLTAPPLRLPGAVGSPTTPIATV